VSQMESEIEKLTEIRKRLLNEITMLSFEELNTMPLGNKWSVAQIGHHLYLSEKSFTKAIIYGLKQIRTTKVEPIPLHGISDRSKKLDAPNFVIPSEEPFEIHQIINLLNESRKMLFDVLGRIENKSVLAEKSAKHPLLGDVPLTQMVELIYLHEQRHIEQITEMKLQI
jgi:hypothetical protein